MSKRRKKESRFKSHNISHENFSDNDEDYTTNYKTYDFVNEDLNNKNSIQLMRSTYHENLNETKPEIIDTITDDCETSNENICRDFSRNLCRRGRKCRFKHINTSTVINNTSNLVQKLWPAETSPINNSVQFEVNFCHDFQNNGCNRPQCRFIHCSRSEQEFYYATGILLQSVSHNNVQVPFCKDFLNNSCLRTKCKYLHLTKEELDQQQQQLPKTTLVEPTTNIILPSSTTTNYLHPSFTVSVPLGSAVSYSNCQTTVSAGNTITQQPIQSPQQNQQQVVYSGILHNPTIAPAQFTIISDNHHTIPTITPLPIVTTNPPPDPSSGGPPSSLTQNTSPTSVGVVPGLPIHHPIAPPPQSIVANNQSPIVTALAPSTAVGMSLFSVATPCSFISAAPSNSDMIQHHSTQQIHAFEQKDATCLVHQKPTITQLTATVQPPTLSNNQIEHHISSDPNTITPIAYFHHQNIVSNPIPITQYRVTALETTNNNIAATNPNLECLTTALTSLPQTNVINTMPNQSSTKITYEYNQIKKENELLKRKLLDLEKQTSDLQTANELLLDQNARLRNIKSSEHHQQCELNHDTNQLATNNGTTASITNNNNNGSNNSIYVNVSSSTGSGSFNYHLTSNSNVVNHNNSLTGNSTGNEHELIQLLPNQNKSTSLNKNPSNPNISNGSEMATITLTVPLTKTKLDTTTNNYNNNSISTTIVSTSNCILSPQSPSRISSTYSCPSVPPSSLTTSSSCSYTSTAPTIAPPTSYLNATTKDYLSPSLFNSAIDSIQKSVMPTLQALMASSTSANNNIQQHFQNYQHQNHQLDEQQNNQITNNKEISRSHISQQHPITSNESLDPPIRSSSCPVSSSLPSSPSVPPCDTNNRSGAVTMAAAALTRIKKPSMMFHDRQLHPQTINFTPQICLL